MEKNADNGKEIEKENNVKNEKVLNENLYEKLSIDNLNEKVSIDNLNGKVLIEDLNEKASIDNLNEKVLIDDLNEKDSFDNLNGKVLIDDLNEKDSFDNLNGKVLIDNSKVESKSEGKTGCWGATQTMTLVGFFGCVMIYGMRINLSVAVVAMKDDFNWDARTQGVVLSSFFYGYCLTQILGGRLADYFGGRFIASFSLIICAILTLISPIVVRYSTPFFIGVRAVEGLAQGLYFPALTNIISNWTAPEDRSKVLLRAFTGLHFGTVVALLLSGYLSASDFLGGWPSVFYVFGVMGLIAGIVFFWFVRDDPRKHSTISDAELKHILDHCEKYTHEGSEKAIPVPWMKILKSKYFWLIAVAHLGNDYGFFMLITLLPTYMDEMLNFDIKSNGFLSSLPYLGSWIFAMVYSALNNKLTTSGKISIVNARKMSMAIGTFGPMLSLLCMSFTKYSPTVAVTIITIGASLNSALYSGCNCSMVDIAPRFAGTTNGLSNTLNAITGFLAPTIAGAILLDNQTMGAWRIVFLISVGIYILTTTPYLLFVTSDVQEWNDPPKTTEKSVDNIEGVKNGEENTKL